MVPTMCQLEKKLLGIRALNNTRQTLLSFFIIEEETKQLERLNQTEIKKSSRERLGKWSLFDIKNVSNKYR